MVNAAERAKYKHTYTITVRNYEIDWQGIVHNANYLLYFEVARVDYFKQLGMDLDQRAINGESKIVVVRNELDYAAQATFGDVLTIDTRIVAINYSSIECESIMYHKKDGSMVSKNKCILVWLDPATNTSVKVPDRFRKSVQQFEGDDAAIQQTAGEKQS
jgi:acyl-CoA thioester hydrolase